MAKLDEKLYEKKWSENTRTISMIHRNSVSIPAYLNAPAIM